MRLNFQKRIMIGIAAIEQRDPLDHEERAKWMNASEAGSCIRQQWYKKFKPEAAGPEGRGYARRGTHMEKYVVEALRAANVPVIETGDDQRVWTDTERRLRGTPDGRITGGDGQSTIIDFKSIDPRTNRKNLPRAHHIVQVQINMHVAGATEGILVYVDASNYDDIIQFDVSPMSPVNMKYIERRANKLLRTKKAALLDREGKRDGGTECRTCPFRDACGVTEAEVEYKGSRGRGNRGSALSELATGYVSLKEIEKQTKEAIAAAGESIKEELKSRKVKTITVGGIDIALANMSGRRTLDRKAMEKAGIDVTPYEKVGKPFERLTVSEA